MFTTKRIGCDGCDGCDGFAGAQFGRENEPHIYVKQYSSGPDTKKESQNITLSRFDQL